MQTITPYLLAILAIVAAVSGTMFVWARVASLNAYRAFLSADSDEEKRSAYWRSDRRQKRLAVIVLAAYAVTFMVLAPFMQPASGLALACMIVVTVSAIVIGLMASICNDKETEARIAYDVGRRFRPRLVSETAVSKPASVRVAELDVSRPTSGVVSEPAAPRRSLIIIGDFGKDMDDEDTLVLSDGVNRHQVVSTKGSRKQELFEMLAVVANLAPALERARLAKGTLELLGRPTVPVGVGTDCRMRPDGHEKEFAGVTYMAPVESIEPGAELLVRSLEACEDKSAILLLISGLTDAANLLREHADLVKGKTALVAIMGGVEQKDNVVLLDAEGYMIPDSAANNKFDMDAARYFYRGVQELGIPTVILTREAAYAAPVPRAVYDRMAATGHPVGIKLQNTQRYAIQDLWVRANMAGDDPRRNKLPERCNREWFCNTFCAGNGKDRTGDNEIWDLIQSFQLYDPMTLIAAIPELAERFFVPVVVSVNGVEHKVIGVSKSVNGVKDAAGLSAFMIDCFVTSLTETVSKS